jgi:hypothetical protein
MLLDYSVDMLMKLPDNYKQLDDDAKARFRYQVSQSILIHAYETRAAKENPLMYKMMRHLQGKTLQQLEAFANATWDNALFPFNECLIRGTLVWYPENSTADQRLTHSWMFNLIIRFEECMK